MPTLRHDDVSQAIRLIAEVRSLIPSPAAAATHLTQELRWLTRSMGAGLGSRRTRSGVGGIRAVSLVRDGGASTREMRDLMALCSQPQLVLPHSARLLEINAPVATLATSAQPPTELPKVQADLYADFRQIGGQGDRLLSKSAHLGEHGRVGWLCLERDRGDPDFTVDEVLLVDLVMQHISPWFWPAMRRPLMLAQSFG